MSISIPWLIVFILTICVIWGNSLVPGRGSSSLSLTVLEMLRSALETAGLPFAWLTHLMVRKAAHFTEYAVLAIVGMQAFRPHRLVGAGTRAILARTALTAAALEAVPVVDETIQLFVDGRSGQVGDVLIDTCGIVFGVGLSLAARVICSRCARCS